MGLWEGAMKVSGWTLRMRAIKSFIIGIILILLGLVLSIIIFKSLNSLIISLFGIIAVIIGIFYWKRSKSLVHGRLYAKEK